MRTAALLLAAAALAAGCASPAGEDAAAPVEGRPVAYRDGDLRLEGWLALPPGLDPADPAPVVLVVHEWWGRTAHADRSAERMAEEGYVALAVDMYGEGRKTDDRAQAGAWAGEVRGHPAVIRSRLRAALDLLRTVPGADLSRAACIGFCFGGTVSLEAAWEGFPFRAVVSFHGGLTVPGPDRPGPIGPSVLVLNGADDASVKPEAAAALKAALRERGADWAFVDFGGAVHSFTNPEADGSASPNAKYHPAAARRAWEIAEEFLEDRLGTEK